MAYRSESAVALVGYRGELGLSARKAAAELRVTHVALRSWETGRTVPSEAYRVAMERWSGGRVRASGWGTTKQHLRLLKKLSEVSPRPTGT